MITKFKYSLILRFTIICLFPCFGLKAIERIDFIPEMILSTTEGRVISLRSYVSKNKLTFIEFRSSGCNECDQRNEILRSSHRAYKILGFNILSINIDSENGQFKRKAAEDLFLWLQVSNKIGIKNGSSEICNVDLSGNFLVTYEGEIFAKNIDVNKLGNLLKQFFNSSVKDEADSLWSSFQYNSSDVSHLNSDLRRLTGEYRLRKSREEGLKFWHEFPNDYRRYLWLENIIFNGPHDWKDIIEGAHSNPINANYLLIDISAAQKWKKDCSKLKDEYLNDPYISEAKKLIFRLYSLRSYILSNYTIDYRKSIGFNLEKCKDLFLDYTIMYNKILALREGKGLEELLKFENCPSPELAINSWLFSDNARLGLSAVDLMSFVDMVRVEKIEDPYLNDWLLKRKNFLSLYKQPNLFEFNYQATDGSKISLNKLNGKVVLIDFWSTRCGSCLAMMPHLKKLYEKYSDKGFEVISVSIDPKPDIEEAKKVKSKIGADWPLVLMGGESWTDKSAPHRKIFEKFGFYSLPVVLLFNKRGQLVGNLGEYKMPNFYKILERLLEEPFGK